MGKDGKIIGGIFALFIGFYVLAQKFSGSIFVGLILAAIGLYLILSELR